MWCPACGGPCSARDGHCPSCGRPRSRRDPGFEACASGRALGGFDLGEGGRPETVRGETPAGLVARGERRLFALSGPRDVRLWLAWVAWDDGECEVRRTRRHETPWVLDRQLGGARLGVEPWGDAGERVVDLRCAGLDAGGSLHLRDVTAYELSAAAGACARCALLAAGAWDVGTRQALLGVGDERRHALCAVLPPDGVRAAVVAYLLTHVAPLLRAAPAATAATRARRVRA